MLEPAPEAAWIAELAGARVGCVFCVGSDDPAVARLRILLVTPLASRLDIGRHLVATCFRFATAAGYQRVTLWTNDVLVSARKIYEAAGFSLVEEQAHHSFGHDLSVRTGVSTSTGGHRRTRHARRRDAGVAVEGHLDVPEPSG